MSSVESTTQNGSQPNGHKTGIAKQIEDFNAREPELIVWNLCDGQVP